MMKRIILLCILALVNAVNLSFALPPIEYWKTSEGAKVYYIHAKEIPMLDIQIAIDAGAFREKNQYGLAGLTANLLTMGAGDLDEEDFAQSLENIGSTIDASGANDTTIVSIRSLSDESVLDNTLSLLTKALTKPHFDPEILKRESDNILVDLSSVDDDPSALANEAFKRALYPNERLSVSAKQLESSIPNIKSNDLQMFFDTYYHANNAVIVLVGDITKKRAEDIAQSISKTLGSSALEKQKYDFKLGKASFVDVKFDAPQSTVILGHVGVDRFVPEYLSLVVGNHILGGNGLNSILSQEIREKRGLTYGVYSGFSAGRYQGPFSIGFSTKHATVDEGINAAKSVLAKFMENGPTADELSLAKNNIIGGFALGLDSNSKLASALLSMGMYGLPLDYYANYQTKIKAISALDIKNAFIKYVHPDAFTVVVVGEKTTKTTENTKSK